MERFSLRHPGESLRELDPNVRSLGLVSFFADLGSEIIYPLFPIFVTTVLGAPVAVLGLIEGIAEATASITKYPFGQAADYTGRRRAFVVGGYGLAAVGKLILALSFVWPVALAGRFVDRFGKGMRTAARDDLIAARTKPEQQGLAFGLHIAATEGTSKALIGRAIPTGERASALGLYYTATGLAAFAASTIGGVLWSAVGPWATFAYGAAAALAAAALMLTGRRRVR